MKFFSDILGDIRARVPLIKIAAAVKIFALLFALYAIASVVLIGIQISNMQAGAQIKGGVDMLAVCMVVAKPLMVYVSGLILIFAFAEILKVFAHFDSYVNRKNKIHSGNNHSSRYNNRPPAAFVKR